MTDERKSAALKRLIAALALAAAVAGAVAIYVRNAPDGNGGAQMAGTCPANPARSAAIDAAAKGEVAAMQVADPQQLGDIGFTGPDGQAMTLADFAGKTILLNLWATWCAPCRAEMPALDRLQQQIGGEEFEVVAINIDTGELSKPAKFLDEINVLSLPLYHDQTMGVFNAFKKRSLALGLPTTMLIDGDGCLMAKINGPAEWDSPDAVRLIDAALNAGQPTG
ncbi:MAG: TlpA family protein disulfide reductase [Notoacmeibacter sp.]|nr:TlpA family protein disulfide reductase [Notoacmeibacter sp.]